MYKTMKATQPMRERITTTALDLLREGGARKFGQLQVAKAAGIPQGHLTYYFPKRSDLLSAVARTFAEEVAGELMAIVSAAPEDAEGRLKAAADFVERLARDRARTRVLVALLVEAEEDPALWEQLLENMRGVRTAVAHLLGFDVDAPEMILVQVGFWGLGLRELLLRGRPDGASTTEVFTQARTFLSALLRTRAPKGRKHTPRRRKTS